MSNPITIREAIHRLGNGGQTGPAKANPVLKAMGVRTRDMEKIPVTAKEAIIRKVQHHSKKAQLLAKSRHRDSTSQANYDAFMEQAFVLPECCLPMLTANSSTPTARRQSVATEPLGVAVNSSSAGAAACSTPQPLLVLLNEMRQAMAIQQNVAVPAGVTALFCGMHAIVNLAAAAKAGLREYESCVVAKPVGAAALAGFHASKSESGTQRLIRTVCKAFHSLGSEQCGVAVPFRAFLATQGVASLRLDDFRGNRAYITFPNGGSIFWQRELFCTFLSSYCSSGLNRLLLAVQEDLSSQVLLNGCRALGILDILLIRPLWVLLRCDGITILDMNERYERACAWLRRLASAEINLSTEMDGPFPELHNAVLKDATQDVWESLTSDENSALDNEIVCQALQILAAHMVVLLEREVKDHLPGGSLRQLPEDTARLATNAPKDNVAGERLFAVLDRSMVDKANMRPGARESLVLYGQNATSDWLTSKAAVEKNTILSRARKLAPLLEKRWKHNAEALRQQQQERFEAKEIEKQRKEEASAATLRRLILDVGFCGGLWSTVEQMHDALGRIEVNLHGKAIKSQLRLFKATKLRLPKEKAKLLNLTSGGVQRSTAQLRSNLEEALLILEQQQSTAAQPTPPQAGFLDADERKSRVQAAVERRLARDRPNRPARPDRPATSARDRGASATGNQRGSGRGRRSSRGQGAVRVPESSSSRQHQPGDAEDTEDANDADDASTAPRTLENCPDLINRWIEMRFEYLDGDFWETGFVLRRKPVAGRGRVDVLHQTFVVTFKDFPAEVEYDLYRDWMNGDLNVLEDDDLSDPE